MKYLLILLVIAVVAFMLGAKQRPAAPEARRAPPPPPQPKPPQDIVRCAHCGLHLPQDEALPGRGGMFCGAAHRAAYEAAHGGSPNAET